MHDIQNVYAKCNQKYIKNNKEKVSSNNLKCWFTVQWMENGMGDPPFFYSINNWSAMNVYLKSDEMRLKEKGESVP